MKTITAVLTKHERLADILRLYAWSLINEKQFLSMMKQYGLTDDDIQTLCEGKTVE